MRFWMSWIVAEEDYRPLTYPPNAAILGWWKSGEDMDGNAILCGLVQASDEDSAENAVTKDWPGIEWRFVNPESDNYVVTSDRFPLSDWMTSRMGVKV